MHPTQPPTYTSYRDLQDAVPELVMVMFLAFMVLYGAAHALSTLFVPTYRKLDYGSKVDWCTRCVGGCVVLCCACVCVWCTCVHVDIPPQTQHTIRS